METIDKCVIGTTDSTISFPKLSYMLNLDSELKFPIDVPMIIIRDDLAFSYSASIIAATHILAMHYGFETLKDSSIFDQVSDDMKHKVICSHVMVECAFNKNAKKALPDDDAVSEIITRLPHDLLEAYLSSNVKRNYIWNNVYDDITIYYMMLIKAFATYYKWERWEDK